MRYVHQIKLALIGLISITLFDACTHRRFSSVAENTASKATEHQSSNSDAKDVITRYYALQIKGDYNAAYNCLSRQTQKSITRRNFVLKARANNTSSVQFKRIDDIHIEQQAANKMLVGYTVQALINEAEATRLREAGHNSARPGLYTFTTVTRQLTREGGKWRIELPSK